MTRNNVNLIKMGVLKDSLKDYPERFILKDSLNLIAEQTVRPVKKSHYVFVRRISSR